MAVSRTFMSGWADDSGSGTDGTIIDLADWTAMLDAVDAAIAGRVYSVTLAFTEDATHGTHTGTVTLPAGSTLHNIEITSSVLWGAGTSATLKVGDTADDDGYFTGVNLKATDLLVGEMLSFNANHWGGKQGAYMVAATGRRGPTASNFGPYYAAGSNITGIVTVVGASSTAGRTWMTVTYSVGTATAAVAT